MPGDTYIKAPDSLSFEAFCKEMSNYFSIQDLEFRLSDNWANGEYARGKALGINIKLAHVDDQNFDDYKFFVSFDFVPRHAMGGNEFLEAVGDFACRKLTLLGWGTARDPDGGKVGGRKIVYSLIAGEVTTQTISGAS